LSGLILKAVAVRLTSWLDSNEIETVLLLASTQAVMLMEHFSFWDEINKVEVEISRVWLKTSPKGFGSIEI
jgi:hypothetical protein